MKPSRISYRWPEFSGHYVPNWKLAERPAFKKLPSGAHKRVMALIDEYSCDMGIEVKVRKATFASGRKVYFIKSAEYGCVVTIDQDEVAALWAQDCRTEKSHHWEGAELRWRVSDAFHELEDKCVDLVTEEGRNDKA